MVYLDVLALPDTPRDADVFLSAVLSKAREGKDGASNRMKPIITFEVYRAPDGYRVRVKHSNGNILFDGGESYKRKKDCEDMVYNATENISAGNYRVVEAKKK